MEPDDAGQVLTPQGQAAARLLVLYANVGRAMSVAQRLSDRAWQLVLCPRSLLEDDWLAALRPDLILFVAPDVARDVIPACSEITKVTDVPIAVLSPKASGSNVARALELGIDEFLCEPIGAQELTARLSALLRRAKRYGRENGARTGDLILSGVDHSVERRGRKISLSPIEFRLLSCLAGSPGVVLTHQTLMARVWGAEYVDSRHYLRLYIRYLREKLEDDPTAPKLIVSEWGVGYRFDPQTTTAEPAAEALLTHR